MSFFDGWLGSLITLCTAVPSVVPVLVAAFVTVPSVVVPVAVFSVIASVTISFVAGSVTVASVVISCSLDVSLVGFFDDTSSVVVSVVVVSADASVSDASVVLIAVAWVAAAAVLSFVVLGLANDTFVCEPSRSVADSVITAFPGISYFCILF